MYELQFASHLIDLLLLTLQWDIFWLLHFVFSFTSLTYDFIILLTIRGKNSFGCSFFCPCCHIIDTSTHTYNPLDTSKGIRFYSMNMVLLCSSYETPKQIYKKKIYVLEWLTWPRSRFQITRNHSMVMAFFFKVIGGKFHIKTHTIINK